MASRRKACCWRSEIVLFFANSFGARGYCSHQNMRIFPTSLKFSSIIEWIKFIYWFSAANASHRPTKFVQHSHRVTFYARTKVNKNILRNTAFIHSHHTIIVTGSRPFSVYIRHVNGSCNLSLNSFIPFHSEEDARAHTWKIENEIKNKFSVQCMRPVCRGARTYARQLVDLLGTQSNNTAIPFKVRRN